MLFDFVTNLDWRGVLEMTVSGIILLLLGIGFGSVRAWFDKKRTEPKTERGWVYDSITKMRALDSKGCYLFAQGFVSRYLREKAPLMLNAEQRIEDLNHLIDMLDEFLADTPYEMFAGDTEAPTLHFGEHKVRLYGSVFYIQWLGKYYTHSVPDGVDSLEDIPGYTHESEILSKNHAALVEFLDLIEVEHGRLSKKVRLLLSANEELEESTEKLRVRYECLVAEKEREYGDAAYTIDTLAGLLDVSSSPLCDMVNQTVQHVDFLRSENTRISAMLQTHQDTIIDLRAKVRIAQRERRGERIKRMDTQQELKHYKAINTELSSHLDIAKEAYTPTGRSKERPHKDAPEGEAKESSE